MTVHELEVLRVSTPTPTHEKEDEYSIPIDISDIINICREFTKLTWQMQNQIDSILEMGVEESIKSGAVQRISLPHIKSFLMRICDNAYFGDAVSQSSDCIRLIQQYEETHKISAIPRYN